MRTAIRDAVQAEEQDVGSGVPSPHRRTVQDEDNSEAPSALHRGSAQGRRDLRLAEARHPDIAPGDSSSDSGSSSSSASL